MTANATEIYPFSLYNRFYFGDGSELYSWGDFDYSSELGTVTVAEGEIVRNNDSEDGVLGHFYQALNARGSIDLLTEEYENETNWADVTEVPYFASSVVRVVTAHDPSAAEVVKISILKGAEANGTITVVLDNVEFTTSITAGASVATILTALNGTTTAGWTKVKSGNSITYTKTTVGTSAAGYVDPGTTGVTATYETLVEGKDDDNDLSPIKKCTMFLTHTASYRVFAAGNPDDNAVYYSEIGQPTYFKSAINKLYSSLGYGGVRGMLQLSESVLISYEDGWYAWDGITPLQDAEWKPLNLPYGCVSHRSIVLAPYSFMYLGRDGIYNVSASILNSELILLQGENIIKKVSDKKIDKTIASIAHPEYCKGVFYDNAYYLAYNTGEDGNILTLKYEWGLGAPSVYTGWKVNAWLKDPEGLFFASKNYFLKVGEGESDIDVETGLEKAIILHVRTKEYALGDPLTAKLLNLLGLIFKQTKDEEQSASSVDVKLITGYESHMISYVQIENIAISESLIWGRDWGSLWGFREAIVKIVEISEVSNTFQLDITNDNLNDPVLLIGFGFVFEETDFLAPTNMKDEDLLS